MKLCEILFGPYMGKPKPTAYKLCDTLTFAICKGIPAVREQTNRLTRVAEGPDQVGETLLLAYQGYVKIMIDCPTDTPDPPKS